MTGLSAMVFGGKQPAMQASASRLAGITGAGGAPAGAYATAAASPAATPQRRVSVKPDVSRIRKISIDETPEERKKRLAAKTVNFGATIIARMIIIGAAGLYAWKTYQFTGQIHRGVAIGMFAMTADLGRVALKALEPGSK